MNITETCVRKPVLAWMLMAATVVFGLVAASRIGISQFPDVDFPNISVSVTWEGAAPEVVENDLVEILEEALVQVEGMRTITSYSRMGSAYITLELDISRDVDFALQDVQAKVSQAQRRLPRDIDPPIISKSNPEDQPIIFISLAGPFPLRVLSDYVRYGLKEKLQTIPGVGEITMMGALDRNVRVWLDATKLDEKNLTVRDVITALQREHVELPAGRLETTGREMNVRVLGEALDLDTLRNIVIKEVNGSPIYVSDVALVEDGFEDVRRIARMNGLQGQGVAIKKQRGANAVAVGIVVDDAIMVMENIFRHREGGKGLVKAALEGTHEIAFAALAATLAVVAIFVPVVFMKGIIGRYFLQFGITLCLCVLLSYVEAVTLAPARCSQFLKTSREGRSRLGLLVDNSFRWLEKRYGIVLGRSLRRPGWILAGGLVLFVIALLIMKGLPGEFVPSQDLSRISVRFQTAVGSDIKETEQLMNRVENTVRAHPEVVQLFGFVGGMGGGVNQGNLFATLVPPKERKLSQQQIQAVMRRELNLIPGVRAVIQDMSQQGFTAQRGFPVEFSVRGSNWDQLVGASQDVMAKMAQSGMVTDVDTDYQLGMPELQIEPDRAVASDLGVSVDDVATTLNALVGGIRVGKYSTGGRRIDVRLKLLADQRSRPEDIARLKVQTRSGELVPLSSLVNYAERPALQAITRRDRERAISIYANVAPGHSQNEALKYVESLGKGLPVGNRIVLGGASVAFRESMSSLIFALFMGIAIAYMILASQFNSYKDPFTIITILPLSIAGAAVALLVTRQSLNIFSMIGLLLLMGIVKKNSIILVDYANAYRDKGFDARESMRRPGPIRLRPILMTATATLMAAIPPALGLGPGSEIRMPMAIAVIGGLVLSTILSLVVVPSFYVIADKLFKRRRRTVEEEEKAKEGEAAPEVAPGP